MRADPSFQVASYKIEEIALPDCNTQKPDVNIESSQRSRQVNALLLALRQNCRTFSITWDGSYRVPFGAVILECEITWTQHGRVLAKQLGSVNDLSEQIGTYERRVDCGGPRGTHHEMVLFIEQDAEKKLKRKQRK